LKSLAGTLAAPFPYFGGKSLACETVWAALGDPENYVEPFAGSAAMLLGRPNVGKVETINDADGFVAQIDACRREVASWPAWMRQERAAPAWMLGWDD
jgi:site-specific DNA-adenine methylase